MNPDVSVACRLILTNGLAADISIPIDFCNKVRKLVPVVGLCVLLIYE
jgi:hypothetical protein